MKRDILRTSKSLALGQGRRFGQSLLTEPLKRRVIELDAILEEVFDAEAEELFVLLLVRKAVELLDQLKKKGALSADRHVRLRGWVTSVPAHGTDFWKAARVQLKHVLLWLRRYYGLN
jgi:hypothetical protein